ncbi:MAG TPA: SPO1 DNA polymerase [Nitrosomonas nitrosa]|uniref:Type-5 uracil-DNA glycosylase n=1 Tax=Nitrosomonas nitrosa TaxID=52442 RepID=A0A1I4QM62_9PROT|nr:uracil-DNA glycosylase [Nitrosomonas nitrosa]PTQ98353.1 uracil-DNA glycosylase family 4 [Nitrosomonas nitrosa]SFM40800.1 uracil-DNA glycosylase, family 4 [Nitrosomonas nitrosa]HBZ29879.1 SPO1 DNA polymerase [Nitrosomonas nitrosa]HNP50214.1 uracil-DNA glycosylase [Nitrosomonas nitrosa]
MAILHHNTHSPSLHEALADCRQCHRLAKFLETVKTQYPSYHAKPVQAFGDSLSKLLIIGLAPGMHGANRTGRPFTGDFAGILLYQTLHKFGLANHRESISAADGLQLLSCRITNAVKCLPPANKPLPGEIRQCNAYLAAEIADFTVRGGRGILALGRVAHEAGLMALALKMKSYPFSHGAVHNLPNGLMLYDSYHCSRYNTQTKRLTAEMFEQVIARVCADLALPS